MIEQIEPADRAAWHKLHDADITSSEIAGLIPAAEHPYTTPYSIWAVKSGRVAVDRERDSDVTRRGKLLESVAAVLAAEAMPGATIKQNRFGYWRDPSARIGATPDLIVTDKGELGVVELKSIEPSIYARKWPDGEPPLWIALQTTTAAKLVGASWAAVGALRVGYRVDFDLIKIPINDGAWARLRAEAARMWHMVDAGTPPEPDFGRDAETIAAINPEPVAGSFADLTDDRELLAALVERERLKEFERASDKECERLDSLIRYKAGEHELVRVGDYRVTLKLEHTKAYSVPAKSSRRLRVKKIPSEV